MSRYALWVFAIVALAMLARCAPATRSTNTRVPRPAAGVRDHLRLPIGTRIYTLREGARITVYPGSRPPPAVARMAPTIVITR